MERVESVSRACHLSVTLTISSPWPEMHAGLTKVRHQWRQSGHCISQTLCVQFVSRPWIPEQAIAWTFTCATLGDRGYARKALKYKSTQEQTRTSWIKDLTLEQRAHWILSWLGFTSQVDLRKVTKPLSYETGLSTLVRTLDTLQLSTLPAHSVFLLPILCPRRLHSACDITGGSSTWPVNTLHQWVAWSRCWGLPKRTDQSDIPCLLGSRKTISSLTSALGVTFHQTLIWVWNILQ